MDEEGHATTIMSAAIEHDIQRLATASGGGLDYHSSLVSKRTASW